MPRTTTPSDSGGNNNINWCIVRCATGSIHILANLEEGRVARWKQAVNKKTKFIISAIVIVAMSRPGTPGTLPCPDGDETTPLLMQDIIETLAFTNHRALVGSPESRRRADVVLRQNVNPQSIRKQQAADKESFAKALNVAISPGAALLEEDEFPEFHFQSSSHATVHHCSLQLLRRYKPIADHNNNLNNLRYVVQDIARYSHNGGLSEDDCVSLLEQQLQGTLRAAFVSMRKKLDTLSLFKNFLRQYVAEETPIERQNRFYSQKISAKHPDDDLDSLMNLGLLAFPDMPQKTFLETVKRQALSLLPAQARSQVLKVRAQHNSLAELGHDFHEPWHVFRQVVIEAMGEPTAYAVKALEKEICRFKQKETNLKRSQMLATEIQQPWEWQPPTRETSADLPVDPYD